MTYITSAGLAGSAVSARWGIAVLLGFSAVDKLWHYDGFVVALDNYVMVPPGFGRYLALFVVCAELWIAAGLLNVRVTRMAAVAAALLLAAFGVALTVNYFLNPTAACGCWFTFTSGEATPSHILFNCAVAALALTIAVDSSGATGAGAVKRAY